MVSQIGLNRQLKIFLLCTFIISIFFISIVGAEEVDERSKSQTIFSYSDPSPLASVAVSPDGSYIAVGSVGGTLFLFNHAGELIWKKNLGSRAIGILFSEDEEILLSVSLFGSVNAFNLAGDVLWEELLETPVTSYSFSIDGNYLALGSDQIFLFDRGGLLWNKSVDSEIYDLSVAEDGSAVIAISKSVQYYYIDKNGNILFSDNAGGYASSIASNGDFFIVGSSYPKAFSSNGIEMWRLPSTKSPIVNYIIVKKDNSIFGINDARQVFMLNSMGSPIWSLDGYKLNRVRALQSGERLAAASDSNIYLFNYDGDIYWAHIHPKPIRDFSFSSDGLYVAYTDGSLHFTSTIPSALSIETNPAGAEVIINGSMVGVTPLTITDLREAVYPIVLTMDGYEDWSDSISTKAGEMILLTPTLSRGPGSVEIISDPEGAYVYLEDQYYGTTPCIVESLSEGSYIFDLVMDGYFNSSDTVQVVAFETTELNLTLTQKPPDFDPLSIIKGVDQRLILGGSLFILLLIGGVVVYMKRNPSPTMTRSISRSQSSRSSRKQHYEILPREFPDNLLSQFSDVEYVGKGGFGMVYKATRIKDGETIAVKFPLEMDPETGKSFLKEIKNWGDLKHKNIVELYDINILPIPYFEMEYVDSGSIEEIKKPIDPREASRLVFDIAEGLKVAHSRGIIHRDLKPHNVLMTSSGIPKIMDWGLSKVTSQKKTSTAVTLSPLYASPEQISPTKFGDTDNRTDIYQLGSIFYELVTGQLPFPGSGVAEISTKIIFEEPPIPSSYNPDLKPLDDIIMKCLRKNKEERYQTISDFQADVGRYLDIELKETMKRSMSMNNTGKAVYYCADLILINMKMGDLPKAYSYLLDLIKLMPEENRQSFEDLSLEVKMRIEHNLNEISEDLIIRSEIMIHQLLMSHI